MNTNSDSAILLLEEESQINKDELQFHSFTPTSSSFDMSVGGHESAGMKSSRNSSGSNAVLTTVYSRSSFETEEEETGIEEEDVFLSGPRVGSAKTDQSSSGQSFAIWQWEYFGRYFDVTTNQVLSRILYSLMPMFGHRKSNYIESHIQSNPDLFGPIWVSMTLIFSISICGNIANYIESWQLPDDKWQDWHYDYAKVGLAASTISLYVSLVPTTLCFFFWFRGCTLTFTLTESISAYGYSLSIYIPLSLLWLIINIPSVRLILLILSTAMSASVLCLSFSSVVQSDPTKSSYFILLLIFVMHALLAFAFLQFFF
jgi:hypothetical protein